MTNRTSTNGRTARGHNENASLADRFGEFFRTYYRDDIAVLAQKYPQEQRSLEVDYGDLFQWDRDVVDDWIRQPNQIQEIAEEALRLFDLPADVQLTNAHVRLVNLPEDNRHHPGHFSPTEVFAKRPYIGIKGEVIANTEVYPSMTDAAFECQRCGTLNYIPQEDNDYQEPHDCQGCEREGPFKINFNQSEFVDAQKVRVSEPPEVAAGEGQTIDVFLEDDIAGEISAGDRVTVNGRLQFQQRTEGNSKTNAFDTFVDGSGIEIESSDHMSLEIEPEEREEIEAIAEGKYGTPLHVLAHCLAPGVFGEEYDHMKRALVLSIIGGEWVTHEDGSVSRGSINVLLVGDPGTAKSQLIKAAENHAPRSVGVSGKGSQVAGITASAVKGDDFSDGQWSLKAGAFVKANGGIVRIDELDDMPEDVRSAMLEPMANGEISVSKAGINATLQTRVCVAAAANPKFGRFDPYEPIAQQVDLSSTLISRFDVAYTLTDDPEHEHDQSVGRSIVGRREHSKKLARSDIQLNDDTEHEFDVPIEGELLTKYLAMAKRQPEPVFASKELQQQVSDTFAQFRAKHTDEDTPVPATFRKLEAMLRLSEAAAKAEFSDTIEEHHVAEAIELVMRSMEDFGMNEEGQFDADVVESGTSKPQRQRIKMIEQIIEELCDESEANEAIEENIIERAMNNGVERKKAADELQNVLENIGSAYCNGKTKDGERKIKFLGRSTN